MKNRLQMFTVFSLVAIFSGAQATAGAEVGWLENVSGRIEIDRNGQIILATDFISLRKWDRVNALTPYSKAIFMRPSRSAVNLDFQNALIVEDDVEKIPPLISNLLNWLTSKAHKESSGPKYAIASTRANANGKRISIPLFGSEVIVVVGQRQLSLNWRGGVPPFRFSVDRSDTGELVFSMAHLEERQMTFPGLSVPGNYQFRLVDGAGSVWEKEIKVVEVSQLPAMPDDLKKYGLNENALSAAWLAGVDGRRWSLEAYSRLKSDWSGTEAEIRVGELLEGGYFPVLGGRNNE